MTSSRKLPCDESLSSWRHPNLDRIFPNLDRHDPFACYLPIETTLYKLLGIRPKRSNVQEPHHHHHQLTLFNPKNQYFLSSNFLISEDPNNLFNMKLFAIVFVLYGMTVAAPVAQPEEGSDSLVAREPLAILPPLSLPLTLPTLPGVPPISIPTIAVPPISLPTLAGVPPLSLPTLPGVPPLSLPTLPGVPPLSVPTLPGVPPLSLPTIGVPSVGLPTGIPTLGLPSLGLPPLPTAAPTLPGQIVPTGIDLGTLPGHLVTSTPPLPTAPISLPSPGTAGIVSQIITLIEQLLQSGGQGIPAPVLAALQTVQVLLKSLGL